MRLALINQYSQVIGGTETYLRHILPELSRRNFDIRYWHEAAPAPGREPLFPAGEVGYSLAEIGQENALRALADWHPDVIFSMGAANPNWEACLTTAGPVVHFAHTYHGTCISGDKCWRFPVPRPCHRIFGWQCLVHYLPHRCGGLSPLTMLRSFSVQSQRLETLRKYEAIVTASSYVREEYLSHGFDPERVVVVGLYLPELPKAAWAERDGIAEPNRILFCGRMVSTKGGRRLIEAAPIAAQQLGRSLEVTFLGAGPEQRAWEAAADQIASRNPEVRYRFLGWRSQEECAAIYLEHDLLAVPSVWPEPFGLNGPEAAQRGLPSAAFAVGGITDWLKDGVNGHLASGEPPTAVGLADAIVRSLSHPEHYRDLRRGAMRMADSLNLDVHLKRLLPVLQRAAGARRECSV